MGEAIYAFTTKETEAQRTRLSGSIPSHNTAGYGLEMICLILKHFKRICCALATCSALLLDLRIPEGHAAQAWELKLCSTIAKALMVKQTHVGQGAIPGEPPRSKGKEAAKYAEQISEELKSGDTEDTTGSSFPLSSLKSSKTFVP